VLYSQGQGSRGVSSTARPTRHISSTPERMLDAPGIRDDYYLNLLSWGPNNILAVALGPVVYLWDPTTGQINDIPALEVCVVHLLCVLSSVDCIAVVHGRSLLTSTSLMMLYKATPFIH
jgi:hypothetical protein